MTDSTRTTPQKPESRWKAIEDFISDNVPGGSVRFLPIEELRAELDKQQAQIDEKIQLVTELMGLAKGSVLVAHQQCLETLRVIQLTAMNMERDEVTAIVAAAIEFAESSIKLAEAKFLPDTKPVFQDGANTVEESVRQSIPDAAKRLFEEAEETDIVSKMLRKNGFSSVVAEAEDESA